MLDVVDGFAHKNLVTLPTLMGLMPDFDCHGEDLLDVRDRMQEMCAEHPAVALARDVDQAAIIKAIEILKIDPFEHRQATQYAEGLRGANSHVQGEGGCS